MKLTTIRTHIWNKDYFDGKHQILAELDQIISINIMADSSCIESLSDEGKKVAQQAMDEISQSENN